MGFKKINSIKKLKTLAFNKPLECFIHLNGLRSSKNIEWNSEDKVFFVNNEIDGSTDIVSEEQLKTETNIVRAIETGNFYKY